jgi:hypothetical protein
MVKSSNTFSIQITGESSNNAWFMGAITNNAIPNHDGVHEEFKQFDNSMFIDNLSHKILSASYNEYNTLLVTADTTNNLYVFGNTTNFGSGIGFKFDSLQDITPTNYQYIEKFTNLDYNNNPLFNKKRVIDAKIGGSFGLVITDEAVNNLYICNIGTKTNSSSFTQDFLENPFLTTQVIYIATSETCAFAITDEPENNLYVCGRTEYNDFNVLGLGNEQFSLNTWTRVSIDGNSAKKCVTTPLTTMILTTRNRLLITGKVSEQIYNFEFRAYNLPETPIDIDSICPSQNDTYLTNTSCIFVLSEKGSIYYLNNENKLDLQTSNNREDIFLSMDLTELGITGVENIICTRNYLSIVTNNNHYILGYSLSTLLLFDNKYNLPNILKYNYSFSTLVNNISLETITIPSNCVVYFTTATDYYNNTLSYTKNSTPNTIIEGNNIDLLYNLLPNSSLTTLPIEFSIPDIDKITSVYYNSEDFTNYTFNERIINIETNTLGEFSLYFGQVYCLPSDTTILTPSGYVPISSLKLGDLILCSNGETHPIYKLTKIKVFCDTITSPWLIPAGSIDENYPPNNVKISARHLIKWNDKWIKPSKFPSAIQDLDTKFITYYHISLARYATRHLVINGGCIVETLCVDYRDHVEYRLRLKTYEYN